MVLGLTNSFTQRFTVVVVSLSILWYPVCFKKCNIYHIWPPISTYCTSNCLCSIYVQHYHVQRKMGPSNETYFYFSKIIICDIISKTFFKRKEYMKKIKSSSMVLIISAKNLWKHFDFMNKCNMNQYDSFKTIFRIIILVWHKKARFDSKMQNAWFDTKKPGSTQKCPPQHASVDIAIIKHPRTSCEKYFFPILF